MASAHVSTRRLESQLNGSARDPPVASLRAVPPPAETRTVRSESCFFSTLSWRGRNQGELRSQSGRRVNSIQKAWGGCLGVGCK